MQEAVAQLDALAREFPAVPRYRQHQAVSHGNLGLLLTDLGRFAEAERQHGKALALQAQLTAAHPNMPDYWEDFAGTCSNLAAVYKHSGRPAKAAELTRKAVTLNEKLAVAFPGPHFLRWLKFGIRILPSSTDLYRRWRRRHNRKPRLLRCLPGGRWPSSR